MKYIGFIQEGNEKLGSLMMCLGVVIIVMGISGAITDSVLSIIVSTCIGGLYIIWTGYEIHIIKKMIKSTDLSEKITVNCKMINDEKILIIDYEKNKE